jgi:Protein of unknown function (DUF2510)
MTSTMTAPPGWYPDPAGEPQWRVWNGREWSALTKPFGFSTPGSAPTVDFFIRSSLTRLRRFGVVAYFGGIGLGLSTLTHWPGSNQPTSSAWALVSGLIAIGLVLVATMAFAYCVRAIQGYWSADAFVPVLNVISVHVLIARRLGVSNVALSVVLEVFMLGLVVATFHQSFFNVILLMALTRTTLIRLSHFEQFSDRYPEPSTPRSTSATPNHPL